GQMIAVRVHAPERVVEGERDPGEGMVVAHVEGREHPAEMRWPEPTVGEVLDQQRLVIQGDEWGVQGGQEADEGERGNERGDQRITPSSGLDALAWSLAGMRPARKALRPA